MEDDDCEDQGMMETKVCTLGKCQTWDGDTIIRPALELRGRYWCCQKCGSSYGEKPHRELVA